MSGFDENPFGEPTINDPFSVSIALSHVCDSDENETRRTVLQYCSHICQNVPRHKSGFVDIRFCEKLIRFIERFCAVT